MTNLLWVPDIEPAQATLIKRQFFKIPGQFSGVTVPPGAAVLRAHVQGCGGQGDQPGGGGAYARRKVTVAPSDTFTVQVGNTSTASAIGDSWVKRGSASGELIAYADRGRGSGPGGQAALSLGDVKRDGMAGNIVDSEGAYMGAPGNDVLDLERAGFGPGVAGYRSSYGGEPNGRSGTPGFGGLLGPIFYNDGTFTNRYALTAPAGQGLVCLEWFSADPGGL